MDITIEWNSLIVNKNLSPIDWVRWGGRARFIGTDFESKVDTGRPWVYVFPQVCDHSQFGKSPLRMINEEEAVILGVERLELYAICDLVPLTEEVKIAQLRSAIIGELQSLNNIVPTATEAIIAHTGTPIDQSDQDIIDQKVELRRKLGLVDDGKLTADEITGEGESTAQGVISKFWSWLTVYKGVL